MLRSLFLSIALLAPAPALAKNVFDHNHPDLDWYSIESEHFVVHYPQSRTKENNAHYLTAKWTAQKASKVAEEMWPRMCAEFNYYLKERVHIVILNQGDELEGFTVPQWDWIEVSANPGGDFYRQRGRMDWLPDVLVHEFAHVVSLKANGTFAEGVPAIVVGGLYAEGVNNTATGGQAVFGNDEPFYWTEGGAEYWSDQAGYNWWTSSRDMHIRTTVLEDRLLTYDEWQTNQQSFRWGDGERGYQQGYSFGLYLRQRFGNETYNKFALQNAKGFRLDWNVVVEEVTGVPAETLYNDWVVYITKKYNDQYASVKAEGEVAGRLLTFGKRDWEYADPDDRDAFNDLRWKRKWGMTGKDIARIEREKAKEGTERWQIVPRWSDDGRWFGVNNLATIELSPLPESSISAFTGSYTTDSGVGDANTYRGVQAPTGAGFMHSWDFVPGQDAVVVTGHEHLRDDARARLTGFRWESDGYDWKQIWYYPIELKEEKTGKLSFEGTKPCNVAGVEAPCLPAGAHAIPNTLRGTDPAAGPDGKRIAYVEYTDGVLNVVAINLDGSDKKYLTHFDDGTWIQRLDWSPDGSKLVVALFRNFQQDLYVMDSADGGNVQALTWDRWEDQDPYWAADGTIYFSSDRTGIFNIYRMDPVAKTVTQVTNVIGGAEAPAVTPAGNLVYSAYTAHGWKVYGVPAADFANKDVTADFNVRADATAVKASYEFREDLSSLEPVKYKFPLMAPYGVPIINVQSNARDDVSLQAGGQFMVQDYVEDHTVVADVMLGSDWYARGSYQYQGWYPNIFVTAFHGEFKYTQGYLVDDDGNPETTGDQSAYEIKNQQYYNFAALGVDYPWNSKWRTGVFALGRDIGFRGASDSDWQPYKLDLDFEVNQSFSSLGSYSSSANPRGGRTVDLTFAHAFSDVVYAATGGRVVDDGEILDKYEYNRIEGRWTEQIPVPRWGELLTKANDNRHTIQIDVQAGAIDRNVDYNDEMRAGGQHPSYTGSNSLRPNTLFAGYPAFSLSGETMAMINVAYRFPIRRELNKRIGPFYIYDITAQVMGTAGNLWSYKIPEGTGEFYRNEYGERIANDPSKIEREIPFVDKAHKNGNYLLYDAGAELRVSSTLISSFGWNSFFRVSYGFNEINGYNDVNGDDISDTTNSVAGDELSNETEKAGFRFYVGLGTGW